MELGEILLTIHVIGTTISSIIWFKILRGNENKNTGLIETVFWSIFIGVGWFIMLPLTVAAYLQENRREIINKINRTNTMRLDKE